MEESSMWQAPAGIAPEDLARDAQSARIDDTTDAELGGSGSASGQ